MPILSSDELGNVSYYYNKIQEKLVIQRDIMFKQESLGGGDIKLMFLIGLVLGYPLSICNIFLATFIAFPIALVMLITNKDNIIPFGPFLSMAALTLFVSGITFSEIINYLIR